MVSAYGIYIQKNVIDYTYRSWNVAMRQVHNVPNTTHRYLIESLSDTSHLKSLVRSPKYVARLPATLSITDLQTKLGETNNRILSECGLKNTPLINIHPKMINDQAKIQVHVCSYRRKLENWNHA